MGCSCKGRKNASVTKTPVRSSRTASNGKSISSSNSQKRIVRREIK